MGDETLPVSSGSSVPLPIGFINRLAFTIRVVLQHAADDSMGS